MSRLNRYRTVEKYQKSGLRMMWRITMRGKRGYTCETLISPENANTSGDAIDWARMMFPELEIVSGNLVAISEVDPDELST